MCPTWRRDRIPTSKHWHQWNQIGRKPPKSWPSFRFWAVNGKEKGNWRIKCTQGGAKGSKHTVYGNSCTQPDAPLLVSCQTKLKQMWKQSVLKECTQLNLHQILQLKNHSQHTWSPTGWDTIISFPGLCKVLINSYSEAFRETTLSLFITSQFKILHDTLAQDSRSYKIATRKALTNGITFC